MLCVPVSTRSEISERNEKSRVETLSSVFHILPPIIITSIKIFSTQSNNIHDTKLCLFKSGCTSDLLMHVFWICVVPPHVYWHFCRRPIGPPEQMGIEWMNEWSIFLISWIVCFLLFYSLIADCVQSGCSGCFQKVKDSSCQIKNSNLGFNFSIALKPTKWVKKWTFELKLNDMETLKTLLSFSYNFKKVKTKKLKNPVMQDL